MNDLTQQLRQRILNHLRCDIEGGFKGAPPIDAIMEDVSLWHKVQTVKRARAAYIQGARAYGGLGETEIAVVVAGLYPMPTRTREELREEPVSPTEFPDVLYRVLKGQVQRNTLLSGGWEPYPVADCHRPNLLRHLLDLHDRPTRTEAVPIDEYNPWGDT